MEMQSGAQLEHPLLESSDVRVRVRTVGHFLSEYIKLELDDPLVSVRTECLEGGDLLIRCEKKLADGYSIVLFSEKRKTYQLETKADVLAWLTDILRTARKRYDEMPEVTPKNEMPPTIL
jgi:nitrogen fixation protein